MDSDVVADRDEIGIGERFCAEGAIHFDGLSQPRHGGLRFAEGEFVAGEIVKVDRLVEETLGPRLEMVDGLRGAAELMQSVGALNKAGVVVGMDLAEDLAQGESLLEILLIEANDDAHLLRLGAAAFFGRQTVELVPGLVKHREIDVAAGFIEPVRFIHGFQKKGKGK
jgi:hypothetical protein